MLRDAPRNRDMQGCEQQMIVGGKSFGIVLTSPCQTSRLNRCGTAAFTIWLVRFRGAYAHSRRRVFMASSQATPAIILRTPYIIFLQRLVPIIRNLVGHKWIIC